MNDQKRTTAPLSSDNGRSLAAETPSHIPTRYRRTVFWRAGDDVAVEVDGEVLIVGGLRLSREQATQLVGLLILAAGEGCEQDAAD